MIQQYTNTTTATNYGNEQLTHGTNVPVRKNTIQNTHNNNNTPDNDDDGQFYDITLTGEISGPFPRHLDRTLPSTNQYALTKTHCGGTVMGSKPEEYIETPRSFETRCRSGNIIVNSTKYSNVAYKPTLVSRAVHLIRNPFDNVVARWHYLQKHWANHNKTDALEIYNNTREGFHAWCAYSNEYTKQHFVTSRFVDYELYSLATGRGGREANTANESSSSIFIPCRDEFIRYTLWHNNAIEVIKKRQLPSYTLYYENYTTNWHTTIDEILQFINLQPASTNSTPLEFITGKHYVEEYYTTQQQKATKELVLELSSYETWNLLQHYFL